MNSPYYFILPAYKYNFLRIVHFSSNHENKPQPKTPVKSSKSYHRKIDYSTCSLAHGRSKSTTQGAFNG